MTGAIICIILAFICFCMAVASTRTPQAALFFQDKTRAKGLAFWLVLACIFVLIGGAYMPEPGADKAQGPQSLNTAIAMQNAESVPNYEPLPTALNPKALEQQYDQAGFLNEAMMAQNITAAQVALRPLYDELLALRQTRLFRDLGLQKGDIRAWRWKMNVEKLAAAMNRIQALPPEMKAAPAYLLQMAQSQAWRNGQPDAESIMSQRIINAVLNLK